MFLTVHSTAAIVIGQSIINPWGAFFIGLLSHYLLDIIPHGDKVKLKNLNTIDRGKLAIADHMVIFLTFATLFLFKPDFLITTNIILAIIGALLPDWIMAIHDLTEKAQPRSTAGLIYKIVRPLHKFHHFCHHQLIKYECSFKTGLVTQIIFLAFLWWMI